MLIPATDDVPLRLLSWCDSGLMLTTTPWQHPNDLFCGDAVLKVLSVEELVDCTCLSAICRVTCVSVGRSVLANFLLLSCSTLSRVWPMNRFAAGGVSQFRSSCSQVRGALDFPFAALGSDLAPAAGCVLALSKYVWCAAGDECPRPR